jgi:hypothetical protein
MEEAYIKWSSFPAVVREARCGECLRETEMASGRFKARWFVSRDGVCGCVAAAVDDAEYSGES